MLPGKMKALGLCLALCAASLNPSAASASSAPAGYIVNLTVGNNNAVWFSFSSATQGALPACAEPNGLWLIDGSQSGYQSMLAMLLSAKTSHAQISIQGTGECGANTHERIAYIVMP